MDRLYSTTLLVALVAGALGHLAGLLALVMASRHVGENRSDAVRRLCQIATSGALACIVFAIVSGGVHLAFGHRPGSPDGLGAVPFFAIHPAYLGALFMTSTAAWFSRVAGTRLDRQRTDVV